MLEEKDGWFVKNVRDAAWRTNGQFGSACGFENDGDRFPQIGIHLFVLEPGKPNCRYHRESAQENFLVLQGECLLLINGEERKLEAWDFVHCPAHVTHVLVGAGDGPCAVLAIGARGPGVELFYPASELARKYGAESPEPTANPRVAYSDVEPRQESPPSFPF